MTKIFIGAGRQAGMRPADLVGAITNEAGEILGFTLDELKTILFGVLIAGVIILEPRGMYGLWLRIRNYFKAWPFSY